MARIKNNFAMEGIEMVKPLYQKHQTKQLLYQKSKKDKPNALNWQLTMLKVLF